MKKSLLILTFALSGIAFAQATEPTTPDLKVVSVASNGKDVRGVLFDLFDQAKQSFILDPNISFTLYLSLRDVEFDEALGAILNVASLQYELQNGIYFIKPKPREALPLPKPPVEGGTGPEVKPQPVVRLTDEDLKAVRVTTKFEKTDLREVFRELEKQTGIKLEITNDVPEYKIDLMLNNKPLLDALLTITKATGLEFRKSNFSSIIICKKS